MPSRERELKVVVLGDASSAQHALGKLDRSIATTGANVERQQSKLSKYGPAIAAGAVAGGAALVSYAKGALKAAAESEKVSAQTAAVIKSTGGAAKVSQKQVEDLAGELKKLSGIDDEAIQAGENILLTFTNIKNQGPGKQIFDDATRAAVDMAVAMKTEIPAAALIVGKAVNDPIAGLGALSRVGVQFAPEKEKLIRDLVAVGDTAGAQAIIIGELNTQFGGSAQAAGDARTAVERLKEKWDDWQESVGQWLIDQYPDLVAGLERLKGWYQAVAEKIEAIANWKASGSLKAILDGWTASLDALVVSAGRACDILQKLIELASGKPIGDAIDKAADRGIPLGSLVHSVQEIFRNPFRRHHDGGLVHSHPHVARPGLAADEVPAVLQRGEYVVQAAAVRAVGTAALDRLNAISRPGSLGIRRPRTTRRLEEDDLPAASPGGARLVSFDGRKAYYGDGSIYTSSGWQPRGGSGLRFNPNVRLDTSQIEDRRPTTTPLARPPRRLHAGGMVGDAIPAASPAPLVPTRPGSPEAGLSIDYDRLAAAIAAAIGPTVRIEPGAIVLNAQDLPGEAATDLMARQLGWNLALRLRR